MSVNVKTEKATRTLQVPYTASEIEEMKDLLCKTTNDEETKEQEKKEVMAQFKAELENIKTTRISLARAVTVGYRYEEVKCEIEKDWGRGWITIKRLDNGETVEDRQMNAVEKQLEII